MHKKITEAIEYVLKNLPDLHNPFRRYKRITVIPNKKSDGFWKMEIVLTPRYKHLTNHIVSLSREIGSYYGESLWINTKGRTIKVS